MARVDLPKSNLRERRRRRRIIAGSIVGLLVLLACAAIVGVTWLPFVRIQAVDVSGQKVIAKEDVEQLVREELAGGYFYLFAKSNVFMYPKAAIRDKITKQYPTFASVAVRAEGFKTLGIKVTEREPVALWCGVSQPGTSCFLVDKEGVVFAPAVMYSGDAYHKYFGTVEGESLPQQFLTSTQFRTLSDLIDALEKKKSIRVQEAAIDDGGDARLLFENGFTLIVAMTTKNSDVYERFELALLSDPFTANALSAFEYLDLRFGDKLYYKLKTQ